jgi:hypothetical protein
MLINPAAQVPIIGQPKVGDWFFTMNIICSCGQTILLSGRPGVVVQCLGADCTRLYRLNDLPSLTADGNIDVPLGMAYRPSDARNVLNQGPDV